MFLRERCRAIKWLTILCWLLLTEDCVIWQWFDVILSSLSEDVLIVNVVVHSGKDRGVSCYASKLIHKSCLEVMTTWMSCSASFRESCCLIIAALLRCVYGFLQMLDICFSKFHELIHQHAKIAWVCTRYDFSSLPLCYALWFWVWYWA